MAEHISLAVIGGGPAGMAAAIAAYDSGVTDVTVFERDDELGGILNQCIHNGFGLHSFKEELTGPEYAGRYAGQVKKRGIRCETGSMVLSVSPDKRITVVSKEKGLRVIETDAVILAMGCRERPRGALNIPGMRPQGIYTAGTAQKLVNCEGVLPGKEVVILGSGDIGLIMARRMTLEGAHVKLVAELMPYSGGLKRNIVQCLDDYGIPLKLSHTVVDIRGKRRLEGVVIAEVDGTGTPIPGTEEYYECDTLLLSCGLIPENELSISAGITINGATNGPAVDETLATSIPGIFACGNVLHVHDLVDFVSEEAGRAGRNAAKYIADKGARVNEPHIVKLIAGNGVRYTVPGMIDTANTGEDIHLRFRARNVYKGCTIKVSAGDNTIVSKKKRITVPSEMEDIILKPETLGGIDGDITVEIEEGSV
ncbi:MAG: FAD-dependent oxidoreductase [Ruminiclostridium sp.]|nr:FAD-dependent oxidoreductase [Ruminiclostridium sp.]